MLRSTLFLITVHSWYTQALLQHTPNYPTKALPHQQKQRPLTSYPFFTAIALATDPTTHSTNQSTLCRAFPRDSSLNNPFATRQEFLRHNRNNLAFILTFPLLMGKTNPADASVVGSPGRCVNGEGEGCDSLAEGNEFIQALQKRSLENKENNQKEALYAYYMKNYPGVFALSNKQMVMKQDGSFQLYSGEEIKAMTNAGKIRREYPRTKGGRVMDVTQNPVLVLVE